MRKMFSVLLAVAVVTLIAVGAWAAVTSHPVSHATSKAAAIDIDSLTTVAKNLPVHQYDAF